MREMFERRIVLLREKGNECRRPVTESIGDGLFELRARGGKTQGRLIFCFEPNQSIIFVHAFYKPGKKIDPKEKEIAMKNMEKSRREVGCVSPYVN
jgi:phage-related protein